MLSTTATQRRRRRRNSNSNGNDNDNVNGDGAGEGQGGKEDETCLAAILSLRISTTAYWDRVGLVRRLAGPPSSPGFARERKGFVSLWQGALGCCWVVAVGALVLGAARDAARRRGSTWSRNRTDTPGKRQRDKARWSRLPTCKVPCNARLTLVIVPDNGRAARKSG